MKKSLLLLPVIALFFTLSSCGGSGTENKKTDCDAVCIWDKVSLLDAPNEKAKWITSISLGESVTYLDETASDSSSSKAVEYLKIKLLDGKSGWTRSDFIILNSRPAVFINDANYYNRPDLMTKSEKIFSAMDIVAVKTEQEGWLEIKGKRSKGSWIETGWIKPENLSFEEADLAVAKFAQSAMALKDEDKKLEALHGIVNNNDLSKSVFIQLIQDKIYELEPEEVYYDEEEGADYEEAAAVVEDENVSIADSIAE